MRSWTEIFLNFMLRAVFGMIIIHFINTLITGQGWQATVGMNPLSFCTTGFLGLPGVALLYGLRFYFL
ncbi:MAG: pro-sigmaK processing inhibitor BofA family protein [Lachnospiraceae bacterium]|nr:pro-sigmaK processing inhibitor BofA family protein [Lachnospiraceae bacterium]